MKASSTPNTSAETIKVLLIEDNPGDARLIKEYLRETKGAHFDLQWVESLFLGLEQLRQDGFDLILLDLGLPDSQGLETLKTVTARVLETPVVVLTGLADEAMGLKAIKEGAQDYIIKGYTDSSLLGLSIRYAIERKNSEIRLQQEKDKIQSYLEVAKVMFVVVEADGNVSLTNQKACEILGYEEKEIIGRDWFESFIPPRIREEIKRVFQGLMSGDLKAYEYYENAVLTKGGQERIIAWHNTILKDNNGKIIAALSSGEDITERKQAEEELKAKTQLNQQLIDALPCVALLLDENRRIVIANKAGYEVGAHPGRQCFSTWAKREEPCPWCLGLEALAAGTSRHLEVEDRDVVWDAHWIPITDKLYLHYAFDVTERKRFEEQFRQSQKMESIGTLAGGVAHDFNNLLTAMMGNLELAKIKRTKGEEVEPHLEEMEEMVTRAAQLTQQLLAFSRRQMIQPVPLNLNDVIKNMKKMLSRLLGELIKVEHHLQADLNLVKADAGQMEQIIMNLCVNARDAMPKGGKLILKTRNIYLDDDYIHSHPWLQTGAYVLLEITDTGCGMDEATQQRIFEPFFTTKEPGKGTGLGLSTVYGIIKQHQGYINVYSEPGHGATFKIYLPPTEEKPAAEIVKEKPKELKGGETILLAEDEEALRTAIKNILEMFGYRVTAAKDGQEAWEIYQQEKDLFDLVILDAVMPRLGGMEVGNMINQLNPAQKILFSSGYSAEGLHESFVVPAHMHFIQKPYRAKELAAKVREVLES